MVKIQLISNGNSHDVVVHGQFGIGRVHKNDLTGRTTLVATDVTPMKKALKAILQKHVPREYVGDWDSTLNEYVDLCVLEKLGVVTHPIVRKEDGQLEGFKDGYTIVDNSAIIERLRHALSDVRQEAYDRDELLEVIQQAIVILGG